MAKHTPGPWRVCGGYTPHYSAIHSQDGYIVFGMADFHEDKECYGKPITAPDYETQRANAQLIAAAPDLLNACQYTLLAIENTFGSETETQAARLLRAAIAKAEGK